MISFRYHVVTIVAVFLALAVGVALGGGPLSELGRDDSDTATQRAEERNAELTRQLDDAGVVAAFQDDFARALAPRATGGVLTGRPVAVVTMPGADEAVVTALSDQVRSAGGAVVASYAVQPGLVAADEKPLVDTLGAQLVTDTKTSGVDAGATTYDRIGQLLGRAISTPTDAGDPADQIAKDVLNSLRGAELLTQSSGAAQRASLVLIVLGEEPADPAATDKLYGGLFTGIAAMNDGVVVAGTTASAERGLLGVLRDDVAFSGNVSSVDAVQSPAGQVAAVLALVSDAAGKTGHYGGSGIDGAVPRG